MKEWLFPEHILQVQREILVGFTNHFADRGYYPWEPQPILPQEDPTLFFNNSAIVVYKPYMRGESELESPGGFVVQPCIRMHSLLYEDPAIAPEYLSYFKMCGAFSPVSSYRSFVGDIWSFLRETVDCANQDIQIHAASTHESLLGPWLDMPTVPLVVWDTFPDDYYNWEFGVEGIAGRGLTLAIRSNKTNSFRDVGNIMEIRRDGQPIGYGLGFGLETLISRLYDLELPIVGAKISMVVPYRYGAWAKYADFLQATVVLYRIGVRPNRRPVGRVASRLLRAFLRSIDHLGIPFYECSKSLDRFELEEFGNVSGISRTIIVDLKKLDL